MTTSEQGSSDGGLTRRQLIGTAAAVGATLAARAAAAADLPQRGEFVVRNALVLTMDAALGDLPCGDVHVRGGAIVAVGPDLATSATAIDARGMIALPGLIDTHNHLWNTT